MQDAGIKLTSVASQAYSKTARAITVALVAGVGDPVELAALAKGRLRSKSDRLVEALANRFRVTHHGVMVRRLLGHIDSLDEQLAGLDEKINAMVAPVADLVELVCTIPGGTEHGARAVGRVRLGHVGVLLGRAPRIVGRDLPGQQRLRRQTVQRHHPSRVEVAA
ncbi:MAG TPA: hypothetical protein VGR06_22195 [Actinophytocola sp.]|jgi:transposase|uniref:hypothetical protein n=1 Tax=Actinophytocola sp. TaxID=1872138 RepID=UPI002DFDA28E|nr:hypothetical protein [Actinophytocola sp.]